MYIMKKIILTAVLCLIIPTASADASTVIRSGSTISLGSDQEVAGNFYGWGNTISISGDVDGDILVAGGTVTLNGSTTKDVLVVGGTVSVGGSVGDDVRIIAGEATIAEAVAGSVTIIAARVKILPTAIIEGDVFLYAGEVVIDGKVGGDIFGQAGSIRLNSEVDGDVSITSPAVTLGERAVIAGDLVTYSVNDVVRASQATVSGQIIRNDPRESDSRVDVTRLLLMWSLMVLFGTLTSYLLFRSRILAMVSIAEQVPAWKLILIGFTLLIVSPFLIVILLSSVLGALVGVVALAVYVATIVGAIVTMSVVAAAVVAQAAKRSVHSNFLVWVIGAATALTLVGFVPVLGMILLPVLFCWTLGTLWWVLGISSLFSR